MRSLSTQLSGAQVGITVTNLAIGFLARPSIAVLLEGPLESAGLSATAVDSVAIAVALVLVTVVTMVFGELIPKNLAISRPLATARAVQGFQRGFTTVMTYPIRFSTGRRTVCCGRWGSSRRRSWPRLVPRRSWVRWCVTLRRAAPWRRRPRTWWSVRWRSVIAVRVTR
ncbi:CNNM domain-containing protein [Oerskovia sp. M15]